MLQFIQGLGALCICLGFRVRRTGWLFILPYWYMFLLDKTHWNNHSYLFGLMGLIFTLTDSKKVFDNNFENIMSFLQIFDQKLHLFLRFSSNMVKNTYLVEIFTLF